MGLNVKWGGHLPITRFIGHNIRYLFFRLIGKNKSYLYLSFDNYEQSFYNAVIGIFVILAFVFLMNEIIEFI
jgi:hypothetical protein